MCRSSRLVLKSGVGSGCWKQTLVRSKSPLTGPTFHFVKCPHAHLAQLNSYTLSDNHGHLWLGITKAFVEQYFLGIICKYFWGMRMDDGKGFEMKYFNNGSCNNIGTFTYILIIICNFWRKKTLTGVYNNTCEGCSVNRCTCYKNRVKVSNTKSVTPHQWRYSYFVIEGTTN